MKTIAIMPIKLNNERLPGKNTKLLGGKPLLQYELDNLKKIPTIDEIIVYCSQDEIIKYLPIGITYEKRPEYLDLPSSNFTQIFECFCSSHDADIYIYAHATAPLVSIDTMKRCIDAVQSGEYDSAFCATKIQDYLWQDGKPLNFDAKNLPRSQDLKPVFRETSGIYVFTKDVFKKYHQRIGVNPLIVDVSYQEAIDINVLADFDLAETFLNAEKWIR